MQKLKDAEVKINDIKAKRKLEDIKTCYSNLQSLSDIANDLNKVCNSIMNNYKNKLLECCEKEKKMNIEYIINLSYKSFMDKIGSEDSENELQQIILEIKRSSFYSEYKNNIKIQLMELKLTSKNIDYRDMIKKLKELNENVLDEYLYNYIKEDITNCEFEMANKEFEEVKELLKSKNFKVVIEKMEKLLNEIDGGNIYQDIVESYIKILENIIEDKIKNGNKKVKEIKIFEDFLKKNKYKIDNFLSYNKKLKALKEGKIDIKEERNNVELEEKENISSIFNKNDNSFIKRDRNKVEDYLKEIQNYISKEDLPKFKKCKEYIYKQISNFEEEEKNNFENSKKWINNRKQYQKEIKDIKNIGIIFSYFNFLNKHYTKFDIHTIQLISLLILSKTHSKDMKGVFCKINTGEGKSTIIQFFAAYKVLLGNKVDIVSSSPVLAERDAKDSKKKRFYDSLNIKVEAVTDQEAYSLDIVYGDTTQFSADILLQDYEFIRKRGERGYDVVIIDEVDSMCIDNLATKTQLTKKFSGYQSLYTFYYVIIYVFNFIAFELKLTKNKEDIEDKRDIIKKAIFQRLMGNSVILDNKDEDGVMREVDKYLLEERKKDIDLNESFSDETEKNGEKDLEKKIQKLIIKDKDGKIKLFEIEGKNIVGILYPNFLKEEIEAHLENWIDSVITSFSMDENIDYRIDEIKGKYKKIVPLDYSNTGVSQTNMVWNEALHQILQIINDVEVFPENVNTNFLLIISFFRKYKELYGLTGTIGSKVNQETLQKLYKVELYFIPPNLKSQLKKRNELFFSDEKQWQNKIVNEIKEILNEKRSVLLICSSIKVGKNFKSILQKNGITKIKNYFTEENKNVVEEVLEQQYVILATNLAGRGTDIKISKDLEEAGGLHVIVSFIPINQRVEDQNYGRAGRNGQKGSYSLIFKYNSNNPVLSVESIKKKRENDERIKVKNFRENELKTMLEEEVIFNEYCKYRKEVLNNCKEDCIKEDNEYDWGKIIDSKDSLEKKKEMLKELKNRTLSIENINNPLIKIKYFIQNINKFNEDDKNLFEKEKFYSWSLKMEYAAYLAMTKTKPGENENENSIELIINYYEEVIETLNSFQIDIQNQTILFLFIYKTLADNKNVDENTKTKIVTQNERKKKILQAIIDICKENIETLKKFRVEKSETSYIETSENLSIEMICEKNLELDLEQNNDEIKDLECFIKEFGIEKFEILKIVNKPNYWKNYIVLAVGVIEVTVAAVILVKAGSEHKCRQVAIFLIKQGFKDIVESFQKAMEGKEINLKEWGLNKASEYAKGILSIAVGDFVGIGTGSTLSIQNEIIKVTGSYAIQKSAEIIQNYLTKEGGNKIQEIFGEYITQPVIETIFSHYYEDNKLIVMDLVNGDKYFEDKIMEKTFGIFEKIWKSVAILKPIVDQIRVVAKKNKKSDILLAILKIIPLLKKAYSLIKELINKHFDIKMKVDRFDGSLKALIKMRFQTYEENTLKEINEICKQLIKYNVINQEGKIDINQIDNKEFNQGYFLQIDEEFKEIKSSNGNFLKSADKILGLDYKKKNEYLNYINKISINFDSKKISIRKKEISEKLTREGMKKAQPIIDYLVNFLSNKYSKYIDKKDEREKSEEKRTKARKKVVPNKRILNYTKRPFREIPRKKKIYKKEPNRQNSNKKEPNRQNSNKKEPNSQNSHKKDPNSQNSHKKDPDSQNSHKETPYNTNNSNNNKINDNKNNSHRSINEMPYIPYNNLASNKYYGSGYYNFNNEDDDKEVEERANIVEEQHAKQKYGHLTKTNNITSYNFDNNNDEDDLPQLVEDYEVEYQAKAKKYNIQTISLNSRSAYAPKNENEELNHLNDKVEENPQKNNNKYSNNLIYISSNNKKDDELDSIENFDFGDDESLKEKAISFFKKEKEKNSKTNYKKNNNVSKEKETSIKEYSPSNKLSKIDSPYNLYSSLSNYNIVTNIYPENKNFNIFPSFNYTEDNNKIKANDLISSNTKGESILESNNSKVAGGNAINEIFLKPLCYNDNNKNKKNSNNNNKNNNNSNNNNKNNSNDKEIEENTKSYKKEVEVNLSTDNINLNIEIDNNSFNLEKEEFNKKDLKLNLQTPPKYKSSFLKNSSSQNSLFEDKFIIDKSFFKFNNNLINLQEKKKETIQNYSQLFHKDIKPINKEKENEKMKFLWDKKVFIKKKKAIKERSFKDFIKDEMYDQKIKSINNKVEVKKIMEYTDKKDIKIKTRKDIEEENERLMEKNWEFKFNNFKNYIQRLKNMSKAEFIDDTLKFIKYYE